MDDIALAGEWDALGEADAVLLRYLKDLVVEHTTPPEHLHEEARESGWTEEQLLEAIAFASLECFTAMVNVAGDVPLDGSHEHDRQLRAA
jgi:alkylhydroperoxidase family enzyme